MNKDIFSAQKFARIPKFKSWFRENKEIIERIYLDYTSMEGETCTLTEYAYEMYTMKYYGMIVSPCYVGSNMDADIENNRLFDKKQICRS